MRGANGIGGGGVEGRRGNRNVPSVDFYQRVPRDLTEATTLGAVMSLSCIFIMAVLFLSETIAFARSSIETSISVDDSFDSPKIKLNFDISFYTLPCEYLSVDVLDSLGANRQNITKNVEKWHLDEGGTKRGFHGRNREQREIKHEVHPDQDEYEGEPGEHPVEITSAEEYKQFLDSYPLAFVNFYAPWCIWCQRLHPTWDKLAHNVKEGELQVGVGMVDCVSYDKVCQSNRVRAFPTLRWFENGQEISPDYRGDRTVEALTNFIKMKAVSAERIKANPKIQKQRAQMRVKTEEGCRVSGHLMVNRVPGNFHVEASSKAHNLNVAMTNLTHTINHLTFGEDVLTTTSTKSKRILKQIPDSYNVKQLQPLDDRTYTTSRYHQAFHHDIKVVATDYNMGSNQQLSAYQMIAQSQIVEYDDMSVPEARFSYDISPMSVIVKKKGRKWYDYFTSLSAIIGGTFSTLGLIDAALYKVFKSKKL